MISQETINGFQSRLEQHSLYTSIRSVQDLRCFMEHHVYSVWDFMSLIKYLQRQVAPADYPWTPTGDGNVRRFINELVLEEESDQAFTEHPDGEHFGSHFELYLEAMQEIGADWERPARFVQQVADQGIETALAGPHIPEPSRQFTARTFEFISSGKAHTVAAALALGREHIIPCMFRRFLSELGVNRREAPAFHFYLERHIHLDEDFHAPLSLRLLEGLCLGDPQRIMEAEAAADKAIEARIFFWDGVEDAISNTRGQGAA